MFGQKEEINAKGGEGHMVLSWTWNRGSKKAKMCKTGNQWAHFFLYVYCWIRFPPALDNIGTLVYIHL